MSVKQVTRYARAKINLTLHVTGQREDGYHLLDSLVCFADVADTIVVSPAPDLHLSVDGPLAEGVPVDERNLVWRAAQLFDVSLGAEIVLRKHLPHAAGIGGGSADAAATLSALSELWGLPVPDNSVSLGADVPVCLSPVALRMRGVGDALTAVPDLPPLWAVLANPGVALETPPVFRALAHKTNPAMGKLENWRDAKEFAHWCSEQRNDLQAPARSLAPVIQEVLSALEPALLARMSGSGATCFGLCESAEQADALAADIKARHPQWWIVSTTLS